MKKILTLLLGLGLFLYASEKVSMNDAKLYEVLNERENFNYERAWKLAAERSKAGDVRAQYILVVLYKSNEVSHESYGFKDESEYLRYAFSNIVNVANDGDSIAQRMIGVLYREGWGVDQDAQKAKMYLKASFEGLKTHANNGCSWASKMIGSDYQGAYEDSSFVSTDEKKAFSWYLKAAKQGSVTAMHQVGEYYWDGTIVDQNRAESFKWFSRAAKSGNESSNLALAMFYRYGTGGVKYDLSKAISIYREYAEKGSVYAQYALGVLHSNPEENALDYKESFKWYSMAAEQGNQESINALPRVKNEYYAQLKQEQQRAAQEKNQKSAESVKNFVGGLVSLYKGLNGAMENTAAKFYGLTPDQCKRVEIYYGTSNIGRQYKVLQGVSNATKFDFQCTAAQIGATAIINANANCRRAAVVKRGWFSNSIENEETCTYTGTAVK